MWSEILLLICSSIAVLLLFLRSERGFLRAKLLCSGALIAVIIGLLAHYFGAYEPLILEWVKIVGISFFLFILAITIRELKPEYARYPVFFSYLPLGIIAVYPFISDADVLKDLLNQLLQGGGLVVSIMLFFSLYSKLTNRAMYTLGLVLLTIAYAVYWFGESIHTHYPWTWQLPMAGGLILAALAATEVLSYLKNRNI